MDSRKRALERSSSRVSRRWTSSCSSSSPKRPVRTLTGGVGGAELGGVSIEGMSYLVLTAGGGESFASGQIDQRIVLPAKVGDGIVLFIFSSLISGYMKGFQVRDGIGLSEGQN